MERNNRKRYIYTDSETGSNKIFSMLDKIESETVKEIKNLLQNSDTEYKAEEPITDLSKDINV